MNLSLATLPDDPVQLKQLPVERQAHFNTQTDILLEEIRHLRAQLFGRKSDKSLARYSPQSLPLLDLPEPAVEPEEAEKIRAKYRSFRMDTNSN